MSTTAKSSCTLLIGVGNEFRSDDAIGIHIARRIREKKLPRIIIAECDPEFDALIDAWAGMNTVVVVNAVSSGAPPGTIHRIDARRQSMTPDFFPLLNHGLDVAQAVELARYLGKLPGAIVIYGIEGDQFTAGSSLSPELQDTLSEAVQLVTDELFSLSDDVLEST